MNYGQIERVFGEFKHYVEEQDGRPFRSFGSSQNLLEHESYKHRIVAEAARILNVRTWSAEQIGTSGILEQVVAAIELSGTGIKNNLVFTSQHSYVNKPHQILLDAREKATDELIRLEKLFYELYTDTADDAETFTQLTESIGKKYPLLAYLFYIKDSRKYAPVSPTNFERGFAKLGTEIHLSHHCNWENYCKYNNLLHDIADYLQNQLEGSVALIDAHSFVWIIAKQVNESTTDSHSKLHAIPAKPDPTFTVSEKVHIAIPSFSEVRTYTDEERSKTEYHNKYIGEIGEQYALEAEIVKLQNIQREDLAQKVQQVSKISDAYGYDILSFDDTGAEVYIEVKTSTITGSVFTFYITRFELQHALERGNSYSLYCVYNANGKLPELYNLGNPFLSCENLLATVTNEGLNIFPTKFEVKIKIQT